MRIKCFKTYQVVEFEGSNTTFFHAEDPRHKGEMEIVTANQGNMEFIIVKRKEKVQFVPFYNVQYWIPADEDLIPFLKEFDKPKAKKTKAA